MRAKLAKSTWLAIVLLFGVACPAFAQTYTISPTPFQTAFDNSGNIINAACIWTYAAGTTTPITTYSDNAGSTNSNPIIANSAGRFTVYLLTGTSYKFVYESACTPPAHGTTLRTADNIQAVPASSSTVDVSGTAGESLTAGQAVYLSDGSGGKNSGQWYRADATNSYSSTTPVIGFVLQNASTLASITVRIRGSVTGLSSLSTGASHYISATTPGAITSSAPTNLRLVGQADSATSLIADGWTPLQTAPPNGTLLIGNGVSFKQATLTAGDGVQVTNGAGTITVANGVLNRQVTTQTVANTAVETSVYTYSVAGGTLGTNRTLHVSAIGDVVDNAGGGPHTWTVRVKYGATTLFTSVVTGSVAASANRAALLLDCEISALNATNSQKSKCVLFLADGSVNNAGGTHSVTVGTYSGGIANAINSAAIDSTAAQNLVVTFTNSIANANMDMRLHTIYTEVR